MSKYNYAARNYERCQVRAGRSLAGKFYLPVEPASPTTARADAPKAEAVDSKLTVPAASAGAANLAEQCAALRPTVAKLGLRYER
jgi:hypothetical protein